MRKVANDPLRKAMLILVLRERAEGDDREREGFRGDEVDKEACRQESYVLRKR
jgi:hypothetical protein